MGARRHDLSDEVDLARSIAIRASATYGLAIDQQELSEEARLLAEHHLKEAIDLVVKTVHSASKVRIMEEGVVQLSTVDWVLAKVTEIIDRNVRDASPLVADRMVEEIGKIELPVDGALGKFMKTASQEAFL